MTALLAQYYTTESKAALRCEALQKQWSGRIAFFVLQAKNGYFVISEKQARLLGYDVPLKARRG